MQSEQKWQGRPQQRMISRPAPQRVKESEEASSIEHWVMAATTIAAGIVYLHGFAVTVAMPVIQAAFSATGTQLLWVVNGYALLLSALILVGGALGDRYGRKRVYMFGIALFAAASIGAGLAPNIALLILFRALQGIGAAVVLPGSISIIRATFPQQRLGWAIGMWSALTSAIMVLGPVAGGFIADAGIWRAIFFANLPAGLLALAIAWRKVPESRDDDAPRHVDWWGTALATAALAGLSYGFISASARGLFQPDILAALVGGLVAAVAFVKVERLVVDPLVPLELFRSRVFSGANLVTFVLFTGIGGVTFFLSLNLVQVQGYNETAAGLALVPYALGMGIASHWSGRYSDEHGARGLLIGGALITALGYALLAYPQLTGGPADYWTTFFPGLAIAGVGLGIVGPPLTSVVLAAAPRHESGVASGVNYAVARAARVLAIAILGMLALSTFGNYVENYADRLALSASVQQALEEEAVDFGGAEPPEELLPERKEEVVDRALDVAFVRTFRWIVLIAAGLTALSAALAAFVLRGDAEAEEGLLRTDDRKEHDARPPK